MKTLNKTLAKGTLGTVAVGAMALATATPVAANEYRDRGGIGAEEIIAGAVVIGGIAALAGAFDGDKRDRYRDRRFAHNNYRGDRRNFRRGANNPRRAVRRCINAAERQAQRFGGWRFADVTQVRDVDRTRYGFRVKGRIQVEGNRGYRGRNFDRGRFTCHFDGQGRPEVRFRNLRGLR